LKLFPINSLNQKTIFYNKRS